MKKTITLFILFSIYISTGYSQSYTIKKGYAFTQKVLHGTAMVDLDGNPSGPNMHTNMFLYIETKGQTMPTIKSVVWDGELYNSNVYKTENQIVNVGKRNSNSQNIILVASRGSSLWKIELTPNIGKKISLPASLQNKVIVKGYISNHVFTYVIDRKIELMRIEGI